MAMKETSIVNEIETEIKGVNEERVKMEVDALVKKGVVALEGLMQLDQEQIDFIAATIPEDADRLLDEAQR